MMELRKSGYNTTIDRNAMNVYFVENQPVRTDNIGIYRTGWWYLDSDGNNAWDGAPPDKRVSFGMAGDIPVNGDWNSNSVDEIGVVRNGNTWYLDASGNGAWGLGDTAYGFGLAGDLPVTGDWNLDGRTDIGVFRPSTHTFYLDANGNGAWNGAVIDRAYNFGLTGDLPVTGDWS